MIAPVSLIKGDFGNFLLATSLNVEQLPLDENSPTAMVGFYANAHKLAETELEVKYSR